MGPKTEQMSLEASSFRRTLKKRMLWVVDQVCSVKMVGYWPSSFFACLWTETKSGSINLRKKDQANIQPS